MKSSLFSQKEFTNTVVQDTTERVNIRKFSTSVDDKDLITNLMEIAGKKKYVNPAIYSSNPLTFKGESYYLFTNGFYIFANKSTGYGFEEAQVPYQLDSIFVPFETVDDCPDDFIKLQFDWDSIARKEAKNKAIKENLAYTIKISDDLFCGFNPSYLLDCIQYFKTMTGVVQKDGFNDEGMLKSPVFFQNKHEGKIGILMPYRVTKEAVDKNEN